MDLDDNAVKGIFTSSPGLKDSNITINSPSNSTILSRLSNNNNKSLEQLFSKEILANKSITISAIQDISKPALYIRNIKHLTEDTLQKLFSAYKSERIQSIRTSEEGFLEMAVIYFPSEADAMKAMISTKDVAIDGKTFVAAYREVSEAAVRLENLPENMKAQDINALCQKLHVHRIELSSGQAVVVFSTLEEATLAADILHNKKVTGAQGEEVKLQARLIELNDRAVEISGDINKVPEVKELLSDLTKFKSSTTRSNKDASVSFKTLAQARQALSIYNQTLAGECPGILSVSPSFTVNVDGLSVDLPVTTLIEDLKTSKTAVEPIKVDRNALLRVRKHCLVSLKTPPRSC